MNTDIEKALWAVFGAIVGLLLALLVAFIRNTRHRRTLTRRWQSNLQTITDQLKEAVDTLNYAVSQHNSDAVNLAMMRVHTFHILATVTALFLESEGVKDMDLDMPDFSQHV